MNLAFQFKLDSSNSQSRYSENKYPVLSDEAQCRHFKQHAACAKLFAGNGETPQILQTEAEQVRQDFGWQGEIQPMINEIGTVIGMRIWRTPKPENNAQLIRTRFRDL